MRIVIAGGSGFLGKALSARLRIRGDEVVVLTRRPATGTGQITWHPDGTAGAWGSALDGADAIVNLAGESIAGGRWTDRRKRLLLESRVLPTRSLAAAVLEARRPPRLFVQSSGVGYYGPREDERVTEAAGPGDDFLSRTSVAWEAASAPVADAGSRLVLLRNGLVLSPSGGVLQRMLTPFRLGAGGPFGNGRAGMPWIHLSDWVSLVEWLLISEDAAGPLNATAPEPVSNEVFTSTLARVLHRPALVRTPAFVLRLALGEMANLLLTGQRAVPDKALALGFRFRFPALEPALRDLLRR